MKIGILYSGLYRQYPRWKENHNKITKYADKVLYSSWESPDNPCPSDFILFKEPNVDYNPFEIEEYTSQFPNDAKVHKKHPKRYHLNKQIIGHQLITDYVQGEFDIIVRMRYDTTLGDINWLDSLKRSYNENIVIGFGGWTGKLDKDKSLLNNPVSPSPENSGGKVKNSLSDFMIIHPKYKMKDTLDLHRNKKLFPANKGWYQVLVEPYKESPLNYAGGCMLTRNIK